MIEKKKVGRPTLYNEEFMCKSIIELSTATESRKPMSFTQVAAEWGISRESLNEYKLKHKLFADACTRARALHKAWFEDQVQSGLFDNVTRESTIRLNTNAAKLYAYMCFGTTEKHGNYIDFPIEYKDATFDRRAEILIEMLADRKISDEQYERLDRVLTAQQQRKEGREILEAYEKMKELADKNK